MKGGVFLKKKKKPVLNFDKSSKLPIIFYMMLAVILSCIFMIITLATSGFSFTIGKSLSEGDLNNDGKLSASDALYIIMKDKDDIQFSGAQIDAGDINKDGKINNLDATLVVQYSSGKSAKLGVLSTETTKMESPSASKSTNDDTATNETQQDTSNFVRTGSSYGTAFCTTDDNVYTTAKITNKWQSGGKYYYQVDIAVKNNSSQYIGDTTVEVDFSNDITVEKNWSCSVEKSDFGWNVTTQCNTYISNGGTLKCGMIVSSPIALEIESVSK